MGNKILAMGVENMKVREICRGIELRLDLIWGSGSKVGF